MTSLPPCLRSISALLPVDPGRSQRSTMVKDAAQGVFMLKYNRTHGETAFS